MTPPTAGEAAVGGLALDTALCASRRPAIDSIQYPVRLSRYFKCPIQSGKSNSGQKLTLSFFPSREPKFKRFQLSRKLVNADNKLHQRIKLARISIVG